MKEREGASRRPYQLIHRRNQTNPRFHHVKGDRVSPRHGSRRGRIESREFNSRVSSPPLYSTSLSSSKLSIYPLALRMEFTRLACTRKERERKGWIVYIRRGCRSKEKKAVVTAFYLHTASPFSFASSLSTPANICIQKLAGRPPSFLPSFLTYPSLLVIGIFLRLLFELNERKFEISSSNL